MLYEVITHFAVKDLGEAHHFLGMQTQFERDASGNLIAVKLSNEKLIVDILESFNMTNCKTKSVPLDPSMKLKQGDGESLPSGNRYRELVGVSFISLPQSGLILPMSPAFLVVFPATLPLNIGLLVYTC